MCSCHSILECCIMFSGVKLSMGSFVLFGILFLIEPGILFQLTICILFTSFTYKRTSFTGKTLQLHSADHQEDNAADYD